MTSRDGWAGAAGAGAAGAGACAAGGGGGGGGEDCCPHPVRARATSPTRARDAMIVFFMNAPDFVYGQYGRILVMVTEANRELTAGQVLEIAKHTVRMGLMYNVDPVLIASVMSVESTYRPMAVGSSGEIGLMQILPRTAEWISNQLGEEFSKDELYSVSTNIRYGTWYLSYLLSQAEDFGFVGEDRTRYALLCYNRGIGSVRRTVSRGSNPSNGYDKRVLDIANRYQ